MRARTAAAHRNGVRSNARHAVAISRCLAGRLRNRFGHQWFSHFWSSHIFCRCGRTSRANNSMFFVGQGVRHGAELQRHHQMANVQTFGHGLEFLADCRGATDHDEFSFDHVLGLQRLQIDRKIAHLQQVGPGHEDVQQAFVIGIARRGDVVRRQVQEFVVEVFDVPAELLLRLAVGFGHPDHCRNEAR